MSLPAFGLVRAVQILMTDVVLPTRGFIASDDELVELLKNSFYSHGQFYEHERGLQVLSSQDLKTALLILQVCDLKFHALLKSKLGPECKLLLVAPTKTTYDMIVLVYTRLAPQRRIGSGSIEEFVERVANFAGLPADNQSVFDQVVDALELLKKAGQEVPSYLLEEAVMV